MQKFLLRFLLPYAAIVTLMLLGLNYVFERYIVFGTESAGAYKIRRILTETHPDEIPIFGSSRAKGSFVAEVVGKNYFNYGLDAAQDDVTLFFLGEELKKPKKTPIVIEFGMEGLNLSRGDVVSYLPHATNPVIKHLLGDEYRPWYAIPFVKYYGHLESYSDIYLRSRPVAGQVAQEWSNPELPIAYYIEARKKMRTVFRNDSVLVKRLDSVLRSHPNRMFIFVIPPYHSSYFTTFEGEKDARTYLASLAAFPNVRVLDFGRNFSYPDSLFINTTHLNYEGALRFSAELRAALAELQ